MNDADTIYTYIIICENNELYCGKTNNIERRMKEHLKEKIPKFFGFKGRKPFYLSYQFEGDKENQIKRAGVKFIFNLLREFNPDHSVYFPKYEVSAS